jgi:hypothetical protein
MLRRMTHLNARCLESAHVEPFSLLLLFPTFLVFLSLSALLSWVLLLSIPRVRPSTLHLPAFQVCPPMALSLRTLDDLLVSRVRPSLEGVAIDDEDKDRLGFMDLTK